MNRDQWIIKHAYSHMGRIMIHMALWIWHIENTKRAFCGIWREIK